jgi:hypothetical protein
MYDVNSMVRPKLSERIGFSSVSITHMVAPNIKKDEITTKNI